MVEPISLVDALSTTRAIRRYTEDPIPDADLNQMLWLATRAPSGSNRQGFRFVVLRDGPNAARARVLLRDGARHRQRGQSAAIKDRQALQLRSTVKSQSGGKAPQSKSKKQDPAEPCGPAGFLSLVRQAPAIPTRDRRFHHGLLVSLTHNLSS